MKDYYKNLSGGLKETINFVLDSEFSSFYRDKYNGIEVKNYLTDKYDDFQKIPILTKDELLTVDWEDRNYAKISDLAYVTTTSGTTSINKLLAVPVTKKSCDIYAQDFPDNILSPAKVQELGINRILILVPDPLNFYYVMMYFPKCGAIPIPGNVRDLETTARLCQIIKADAIISMPTLINNLIPELEKLKFDNNLIKYILLQGEISSENKLSYIRKTFPQAKVKGLYGSRELHVGGYQCNDRVFDLNTYHPSPRHFIEILDENNQPVKEGEVGNLVFTDIGTHRAIPLIRYNTGDMASLKSIDCSCGNKYLISLGGRKNYDLLRIFGVTFSSVMLETALGELLPKISRYELHLSESGSGESLKPCITLKIATKENFREFKDQVRSKIMEHYFLSKDKTMSYFIENNIFASFEVELLKDNKSYSKNKGIILDI